MANRYYTVDFYQITLNATAQIGSPEAGLQLFLSGNLATHYDDGLYTRELYGITSRAGGSAIGAQFRKFRTTDLPEIGGLGESGEALVLAENTGLIEQNFFVWYRQHNLIAWHVNGHANHSARFREFLTHAWGTEVFVEPVMQADAMQRLMAGTAEVKRISLTVANPGSPDIFQTTSFRWIRLAC